MRIRSVKPEFWRSKTISELDWDVRFVLKGLESYVDDNGVGKDDIELIVTEVFPRDYFRNPRETVERVSEAISALAQAGLIVRYVFNGEPLLYIDKWKEIQRVDKPNKGRFPRPDGTLEYSEVVDRESYRSPRENFANTPETLAPVTGEQRSRGAGEQAEPKPSRAPEESAASPTSERSAPPPEFCPKHPGGTDNPCRACQRHREARERWDCEQAARVTIERNDAIQRRRDCKVCDGTGWRLDSPDDQAIKCDHPALQLVHSDANPGRVAG